MSAGQADDSLQRFRALVAGHLGLRFEPRQEAWLAEVLGRRVDQGRRSMAAYLDGLALQPSAEELDALAAELTVGETFFFRHHEQFEALRHQVLPSLLGARPPGRRLRVLSAGCASGEEAYSLAICLQTAGLGARGCEWDVQAFDLNPAVLARARRASYGEWSLRATPADLRGHWFQRRGEQFEPLPLLRQHVQFERRNICQADPEFWQPGAFELVFCRNMLMYLEAPALSQALDQLTRALAPGGFLFLGHAETLRDRSADFRLMQSQGCFYYQRLPVPADVGAPVHLPLSRDALASPAPAAQAAPPSGLEAVLTLLSEARHPQALRLVDSLVAADGGNAELLLAQAMLLIEDERLDDSRQACLRLLALPIAPGLQAAGHFVSALGLESRGDLAGAEEVYRLAARLDPGFAMPRLRLGLLARRRGEIVTLRRELRRALALLDGEDERRLLLFGGGFGRDALRRLCRAELGEVPA